MLLNNLHFVRYGLQRLYEEMGKEQVRHVTNCKPSLAWFHRLVLNVRQSSVTFSLSSLSSLGHGAPLWSRGIYTTVAAVILSFIVQFL